MATGIFSTTRVAGEGIALAIAGAVLATLAQAGLRAGAGVSVAGATPDAIVRASARLATGDLGGAAAAWPEAGRALLRHSYLQAFNHLLIGLAVVTLLCAAVVFVFLGGRRGVESGEACARRA